MPKRGKYDHKGSHGKGLIVGGSAEMLGSIMMTVKYSLQAGAGLITAGTISGVINTIASQCIEATYMILPDENGFLTNGKCFRVENYDGIALGIGMGRKKETGFLVRQIIEQALAPVVVDADGLYHVKEDLAVLNVCGTERSVHDYHGSEWEAGCKYVR